MHYTIAVWQHLTGFVRQSQPSFISETKQSAWFRNGTFTVFLPGTGPSWTFFWSCCKGLFIKYLNLKKYPSSTDFFLLILQTKIHHRRTNSKRRKWNILREGTKIGRSGLGTRSRALQTNTGTVTDTAVDMVRKAVLLWKWQKCTRLWCVVI